MNIYNSLKLIFLLFSLISFVSCANSQIDNNQVVVYVSVDQVFASKILKQFEKETGLKVKVLYDTEASKAVGLEKRLLAEKDFPHADIFWNSEFLRTEHLAEEGVLKNLSFTDKKYMKKIGLRSRVFIVNTELLNKQDYPTSLKDLIKSKYKGKIAMCTPYFGTTSTHFAALYGKLRKKKFLSFIQGLKNNHVALLAGNSVVKDAVGHGRFAIGLVDSDDAIVGIKQGLPIKMIYYNQNGDGVFSVYQTVSIIKGAPHLKNAQKLLNYLILSRVEKQLIQMNAVQFPFIQLSQPTNSPKLWTLPAKAILKNLKPSISIMRSYLE